MIKSVCHVDSLQGCVSGELSREKAVGESNSGVKLWVRFEPREPFGIEPREKKWLNEENSADKFGGDRSDKSLDVSHGDGQGEDKKTKAPSFRCHPIMEARSGPHPTSAPPSSLGMIRKLHVIAFNLVSL
jgi:hypothetical protein